MLSHKLSTLNMLLSLIQTECNHNKCMLYFLINCLLPRSRLTSQGSFSSALLYIDHNYCTTVV